MASGFRVRIWAWAILVPVTALTAGCSGHPAEAPAPVEVSTAATTVTITASDGAPSGPLSTRVLTAHVTVAHLADMVNHLQPMPLTPTSVSSCGMAVGLPLTIRIEVTFTGRHTMPATLVVNAALSSGNCNSTRLAVGARTGPVLLAGELTATVVSLLPVPLLTMFKEAATFNGWPRELISHSTLEGVAGASTCRPKLAQRQPPGSPQNQHETLTAKLTAKLADFGGQLDTCAEGRTASDPRR